MFVSVYVCLYVSAREGRTKYHPYHQVRDFDDMSSFFPYEIGDAIQYSNLGCAAQAPKIVYSAFFRHYVLFLSFRSFL